MRIITIWENHIIAAVEKTQDECEVHANQKMTCASTIKFYQHLSVNYNLYVYMNKDGSLKMKDKRTHGFYFDAQSSSSDMRRDLC